MEHQQLQINNKITVFNKNKFSEERVNRSIEEIVSSNIARLDEYLHTNNIEAYRILSREGDIQLNIDIYQDNAVINIMDKTEKPVLHETEGILRKLLGTKKFFYKKRISEDFTKGKTLEEINKSGYSKKIVIEEYGNKFLVNLSDYLDTGLFLDHRETRKYIKNCSYGKTVLNTFAYTGSFSIYAAAGGAAKTYSVDLSKTYCDWIKENLQLNGLSEEKNWVCKMDTMEFFEYAKRKELFFDIIIIDPPTFSKNGKNYFSVQKDHPKLINAALKILNKDGFILFSNNYKNFELRSDLIYAKKIDKKQTLPPDFLRTYAHKCFIIAQPSDKPNSKPKQTDRDYGKKTYSEKKKWGSETKTKYVKKSGAKISNKRAR